MITQNIYIYRLVLVYIELAIDLALTHKISAVSFLISIFGREKIQRSKKKIYRDSCYFTKLTDYIDSTRMDRVYHNINNYIRICYDTNNLITIQIITVVS